MEHPVDTLEDLRKSIDNIDNAIIAMFAERFKVTDRVGFYKANNDLPPKDELREAEQFERVSELASRYGLDAGFAESCLRSTIERVIERHVEIAGKARG